MFMDDESYLEGYLHFDYRLYKNGPHNFCCTLGCTKHVELYEFLISSK